MNIKGIISTLDLTHSGQENEADPTNDQSYSPPFLRQPAKARRVIDEEDDVSGPISTDHSTADSPEGRFKRRAPSISKDEAHSVKQETDSEKEEDSPLVNPKRRKRTGNDVVMSQPLECLNASLSSAGSESDLYGNGFEGSELEDSERATQPQDDSDDEDVIMRSRTVVTRRMARAHPELCDKTPEPEYSQFPAMLSDKDFIVDSDDEDKPGPFSDDEKEEEKEEEEENLDEDLGVCNQYLFASPTADKQKREIERAKEKYRKKLAQKATSGKKKSNPNLPLDVNVAQQIPYFPVATSDEGSYDARRRSPQKTRQAGRTPGADTRSRRMLEDLDEEYEVEGERVEQMITDNAIGYESPLDYSGESESEVDTPTKNVEDTRAKKRKREETPASDPKCNLRGSKKGSDQRFHNETASPPSKRRRQSGPEATDKHFFPRPVPAQSPPNNERPFPHQKVNSPKRMSPAQKLSSVQPTMTTHTETVYVPQAAPSPFKITNKYAGLPRGTQGNIGKPGMVIPGTGIGVLMTQRLPPPVQQQSSTLQQLRQQSPQLAQTQLAQIYQLQHAQSQPTNPDVLRVNVTAPAYGQWVVGVNPNATVKVLVKKARQARLKEDDWITSISNKLGSQISFTDIVKEVLEKDDIITAKIEKTEDLNFGQYYSLKTDEEQESREIENILSGIQTKTGLATKVLQLSSKAITPTTARSLNIMKDHPDFDEWFPNSWCLAHNQLGSDGCKALCELCKSLGSHVTSLDLLDNGISDGADELLKILLEHVEEIDLSKNSLEGGSVACLVHLILSPIVTSFRLDDCPLAVRIPDELTTLSEKCGQKPKAGRLTRLSLRNNNFGNTGFCKIINALHSLSISQSLLELDLSGTGISPNATAAEIDGLVGALQKFLSDGKLSTLCLARTEMPSEKLLKTIFSKEHLCNINLSETNVTTDSNLFKCLCSCIGTGTNIKSIKLSKNSLTTEQSTMLAEALVSGCISHIELNSCQLGVDGIVQLFGVLKNSEFVESLSLGGNISRHPQTAPRHKIETLVAYLKEKKMYCLVSLDLSENELDNMLKNELINAWKDIHKKGFKVTRQRKIFKLELKSEHDDERVQYIT